MRPTMKADTSNQTTKIEGNEGGLVPTPPGGADASSNGAARLSSANDDTRADSEDSIFLSQLPEQLLIQCLEFVGPHCYRYVAGTCRELRATYTALHYPKQQQPNSNLVHIFASKACYQLFLQECLAEPYGRLFTVKASESNSDLRVATPRLRAHVEEAARQGSLECLQFICEQNHICDKGCATRYGKDSCGPSCSMADFAAQAGHLACLQYALKERYCRVPSAWFAVKSDNLDCLRYIHENGGDVTSRDAVDLAARERKLECLRYIHQNGGNIASHTCIKTVACGGHFACVQFIHQHAGGDLSEYGNISANLAAQSGNLGHLRYLMEGSTGIHPNHWPTCARIAAQHGQTECLEYLHRNGIYEPDTAANHLPMMVHIQTITRRKFDFHIQPWDAVETLKEKIFEEGVYPVGRQRLVRKRGNRTESLEHDSWTLEHCGIKSGDTIYLVGC